MNADGRNPIILYTDVKIPDDPWLRIVVISTI